MPPQPSIKPTAKITSASDKTVTDKSGRNLVYRKLSLLENGRLMRACGDHANNSSFYGLAALCCSVRSIDDTPLPMPKNVNEIDGRIGLIGDEGGDALLAAFTAEKDAEESGFDEAEQLKNS